MGEINVDELEAKTKEADEFSKREEQIDRLSKATSAAETATARLLEVETRMKMGGRAPVAQPEIKKEFAPREYIDLLLQGKIPEQQ